MLLAVLSLVGPYGLDMVSAPGHGVSNTAPPTLALLVFGVAALVVPDWLIEIELVAVVAG